MNLGYYKGAVLLAVGVLVGSLVMVGCDRKPVEKVTANGDSSFESLTGDGHGYLQTVNYEGHRYVVCSVYYGVGICHAGDCPCRKGSTCECNVEKNIKD